MESGFWKLFAETGDPLAYLMCVSLEKAEGQAAGGGDRDPVCREKQKREHMPPTPEA